jgi:two-component system OmpR family response regulator
MANSACGTVALPHVLFADDDPDIRGLLSIAADRSTKFDGEVVESGTEALRCWREAKAEGRPFALIVLDGAMPDLSGYKVAEKIRQEDPEALIVFFTAYDGPLSDFRAKELKASAFLRKPQDANRVTETVSELLEH